MCCWLSQCGQDLIADLSPLRVVAEGATRAVHNVEDVHRLRAESLHASGPHVKTTLTERTSNAPQTSRPVMGPDFHHGSGRGGVVDQRHPRWGHGYAGRPERAGAAGQPLLDVKTAGKDETEIGLQRRGVG